MEEFLKGMQPFIAFVDRIVVVSLGMQFTTNSWISAYIRMKMLHFPKHIFKFLSEIMQLFPNWKRWNCSVYQYEIGKA